MRISDGETDRLRRAKNGFSYLPAARLHHTSPGQGEEVVMRTRIKMSDGCLPQEDTSAVRTGIHRVVTSRIPPSIRFGPRAPVPPLPSNQHRTRNQPP